MPEPSRAPHSKNQRSSHNIQGKIQSDALALPSLSPGPCSHAGSLTRTCTCQANARLTAPAPLSALRAPPHPQAGSHRSPAAPPSRPFSDAASSVNLAHRTPCGYSGLLIAASTRKFHKGRTCCLEWSVVHLQCLEQCPGHRCSANTWRISDCVRDFRPSHVAGPGAALLPS